ncbi:alpha-amylase-like [Lineus longissimus]|uniref:alpha-amylase-like n=1 Tax=Lineus longissimus TaxID=88925 RepID=UPI00315C98E7
MRGSIVLLLSAVFAVTVAQKNPNCANGRGVIVHLFEWKWTDVALECERFLGPRGFCGLQVSPANEHIAVWQPSYNPVVKRPWYERYQPVSYKLVSRSGNEEEFADMVTRCNNVGVRVYVDGVFNHMVGAGSGTGKGIGGSGFDAGGQSFPGVPFGNNDFHTKQECGTSSWNIESYQDANQVRNCRLSGLVDLNQGHDYVRGKIIDYMNRCVGYGVAGFRLDAAKHMWPGDVSNILSKVNRLNTRWFPGNSAPFFYQEVIDLGGEPVKGTDYTGSGRVTDFRYGMFLGQVIRKQNNQKMKYLKTFGPSWGMLQDGDAFVFVDNHDNQRGHGAGGLNTILTFFEARMYKMANAFMLAFPFGQPRLMSSYMWQRNIQGGKDNNDWIGPPHNDDYSTKDVTINSDGTCGNGWICEHRWQQMFNMVAFRNNVTGTAMENWWDNGNNQIAFGRGNRGFIAFNNEDGGTMDVTLSTGLPVGQYCDVISGERKGSTCSGKTITVDGSGKARFNINSGDSDPMVAIHIGEKLGGSSSSGSSGNGNTGNTGSGSLTPSGWERTVVLIKKTTNVGEDLFIRGGVSAAGCTSDAETSACSIPIRYRQIGNGHFVKYEAWATGDSVLDWFGAQSSQGKFGGWQAADGSPMAWTTNDQSSAAYVSTNSYGSHYWMWDVDMDCSRSKGGWFEVKARIGHQQNGLEGLLAQSQTCSGTHGGSRSYSTSHHMGLCGKINVFEFDKNGCRIDNF